MAVKSSRTFSLVFAEVSKKSRPASRAYCSASAWVMARLSGDSVTRSSLFPASAMMMFSLAWRCSSLTQAFALSKEDYPISVCCGLGGSRGTYRLGDVVDHYSAVGIAVVHGRERLVTLLARCVPDLELDGCGFIEGDRLREEGGADGGLPVIVELILATWLALNLDCIFWKCPYAYFDKAQY
jgi:hypothetical protein